MEYNDIKSKALKQKDSRILLKMIEDYKLQEDKEVMDYFRKIDNDNSWKNNYYIRKK